MKFSHLLFSLSLTATTALFSAAEPATIHDAVETAIEKATGKGDVAALKRLVGQNPSVASAQFENGDTLLHWAANRGLKFHLRLFPSHCSTKDNQPTHYVLQAYENMQRTEYEELILLLLEHGALVNRQNNAGNTPLHEAACLIPGGSCYLLIKHGASIDQKNHWGETPLHIAAERGHDEIACLLLCNGASADVKNNNGKTPLDLTKARGFEDIADMIQECQRQRNLRRNAARLAFCCYLHPRLGANSPANAFPPYVVQEILHHLQLSDFAHPKHSRL